MKRIIFYLVFFVFYSYSSFAQDGNKEFTPNGHAFGKVFFNYHYDLTKDVNQASSFEIKIGRAHV